MCAILSELAASSSSPTVLVQVHFAVCPPNNCAGGLTGGVCLLCVPRILCWCLSGAFDSQRSQCSPLCTSGKKKQQQSIKHSSVVSLVVFAPIAAPHVLCLCPRGSFDSQRSQRSPPCSATKKKQFCLATTLTQSHQMGSYLSGGLGWAGVGSQAGGSPPHLP